jgi:cysteine desulfurase
MEGRASRAALDRARDVAAAALDVDPAEIVFTASGTEAVNLALLGMGRTLVPGATIVTWTAEHQAVLGAARRLELEGRRVLRLPVDGSGRNNDGVPDGAALISTSIANNEIGTLQPRPAIPAGAAVHLDACQGPRWVKPRLEGVDLASFSGAKLGAGEGGVLFVLAGIRLEPLLYGGPQQRGRRAGPEPFRAAPGVAVALETARRRRQAASARAAAQAERLRKAVVASGGILTGDLEHRLPNHVSAVFPGIRGEDLLLALDLAGVAVSAGSVCASGSLDPSHVLLAAGFGLDESLSGLRLTAGWDTTDTEVERAATILVQTVKRFTGVAA